MSLNFGEDGVERKTTKQKITDENITVLQLKLCYFFGGFDSVSSLMCFVSYEVAVNPDIQERLADEIHKTLEEFNNKLSSETLMKMKYLDTVVSGM